MKFQKDQAIQNLKAKFQTEKNSLIPSDRSLSELYDNFVSVLATDETEVLDFVEKAYPLFAITGANINKDVADKLKVIPPVIPPVVPPTPPVAATDDKSAEMKAMIAELFNGFKGEIQPILDAAKGVKQRQTTEQLLQSGKAVFLQKKPSQNYEKYYNRAIELAASKITEGYTADMVAKDIQTEYDSLLSLPGITDGYIPADGSGNAGGASDKAFFENVSKYLEEQKLIPTIDKKD